MVDERRLPGPEEADNQRRRDLLGLREGHRVFCGVRTGAEGREGKRRGFPILSGARFVKATESLGSIFFLFASLSFVLSSSSSTSSLSSLSSLCSSRWDLPPLPVEEAPVVEEDPAAAVAVEKQIQEQEEDRRRPSPAAAEAAATAAAAETEIASSLEATSAPPLLSRPAQK